MAPSSSFSSRGVIPDGAVVGAATFAVGLLVTYVFTDAKRYDVTSGRAIELEAVALDDPQPAVGPHWSGTYSAPADLDAMNWFYHQMHFVSTEATISYSGAGTQGWSEAVSITFVASTPTYLHLLPPTLLLGAGWLVVRRTGARSFPQAALTGASLVLGYGAVAVLSAYLLVWESSSTYAGITRTLSAGPELLPAVLLTGFAFPFVFGAAGGCVAYHRTTSSTAVVENGP